MCRKEIIGWMCMGLLTAGLSLASAYGQTGAGMMEGQQGTGAQEMSGTMHDMSRQMMQISGEMAKGRMNAAQQKHLAGRMKQMSAMMDEMSGMAAKGMMMDADMQKRMYQIRKQMDDMMKGSSVSVEKK